jgi:plasmid stabilization system protein ParE
MKSYRLSAQARQDYFDAFDFTLSHYIERTAVRWEIRMLDAFDQLAAWPQTGKVRPELAPPHLRFWIESDYVVLYDPTSVPLCIVAILHGAQDMMSLIAKRVEAYDPEEPEEEKN